MLQKFKVEEYFTYLKCKDAWTDYGLDDPMGLELVGQVVERIGRKGGRERYGGRLCTICDRANS